MINQSNEKKKSNCVRTFWHSNCLPRKPLLIIMYTKLAYHVPYYKRGFTADISL